MPIEAHSITHLMKKLFFDKYPYFYTCQFGIHTSRSRDQPAVSHLSDTLPIRVAARGIRRPLNE
ncbi:hypothetical protein ACROAK_09355 [Shewanella oncorhynchi]|uniref:hypothetical protein n=1 Tax=Shewanella oncorhynchi TaxID=2726434 RepID=UPI003D7ADDBB